MNELKQKLQELLNLPKERFKENQNQELFLSVSNEEFSKATSLLFTEDFTLVCLFAVENSDGHKEITLFYVFEKPGYQDFLILKNDFLREKTTSIAAKFPIASWYEREISDGFGLEFIGASDNRHLFLHENYPQQFHPLRKSFKNGPIKTKDKISPQEEYSFKEVSGEGVYHIPVGPVHAGIIEPGHFRFSVIGETILNLEIRLFWKHRGIEKLAEGKSPEQVVALAQAISGDETVANSWAFCKAVESISNLKIPLRSEYLRLIFAEMERIYSLLGDLAGMVVDVAYPVGASPFFILREELLRWNEKLSGSRFYRDSVIIGGIKNDVSTEKLQELSEYLKTFYQRFNHAVQQALSQPSVIDRFETSGIVKRELVNPLNLTGPLARASGAAVDVRKDHPYGLYAKIIPKVTVLDDGDVLCRFKLKADIIENSSQLIRQAITEIPKGKTVVESTVKEGSVLSSIESSRGQNLHWVYIKNGRIERYKVRTASFCNWLAIEHAVLGNIVPDFPLINKSMNLSYAGTDL